MSEKVDSFYPTLTIRRANCQADCSACEETCPAIKAVHLPEVDFHRAMTCLQCGEPRCLEMCPTGAISKSQADGTVRIDKEKCARCGLCTLACPYGGVYYDSNREQIIRCDRCDGTPRCVPACGHGILSFTQTRPTLEYLRHKDVFAHGTALCMGCTAELAERLMMRVFGQNTILVGCAGCAVMMLREAKLTTHTCLFTNVAPIMEGIKTYHRRKGKDVQVVAFVGDGATSDAGFQALSGVAERGENVVFICYDNEAYMNTGIQRSSTTPYRAWTFTTPVGEKQRGKAQTSKYMPLIMAFHGVPYVATACVSHLEDYVRKLTKAKAVKNGMAYIHVLAPCPVGWRAPIDSAIEIGRMAVETNYFPLWECVNGEFSLTYQVKSPRPVQEFTRLMGRYSHLKEKDIKELQAMVDKRFALVQGLTKLATAGDADEGRW